MCFDTVVCVWVHVQMPFRVRMYISLYLLFFIYFWSFFWRCALWKIERVWIFASRTTVFFCCFAAPPWLFGSLLFCYFFLFFSSFLLLSLFTSLLTSPSLWAQYSPAYTIPAARAARFSELKAAGGSRDLWRNVMRRFMTIRAPKWLITICSIQGSFRQLASQPVIKSVLSVLFSAPTLLASPPLRRAAAACTATVRATVQTVHAFAVVVFLTMCNCRDMYLPRCVTATVRNCRITFRRASYQRGNCYRKCVSVFVCAFLLFVFSFLLSVSFLYFWR